MYHLHRHEQTPLFSSTVTSPNLQATVSEDPMSSNISTIRSRQTPLSWHIMTKHCPLDFAWFFPELNLYIVFLLMFPELKCFRTTSPPQKKTTHSPNGISTKNHHWIRWFSRVNLPVVHPTPMRIQGGWRLPNTNLQHLLTWIQAPNCVGSWISQMPWTMEPWDLLGWVPSWDDEKRTRKKQTLGFWNMFWKKTHGGVRLFGVMICQDEVNKRNSIKQYKTSTHVENYLTWIHTRRVLVVLGDKKNPLYQKHPILPFFQSSSKRSPTCDCFLILFRCEKLVNTNTHRTIG